PGLPALDALTSLVEKSLLVRTEIRGEARFQMLETVREMARERVVEAGEERAGRLRLAQWLEGFLAREHQDLLIAGRRQVAEERIAAEMAGAPAALRFAAGPDGDAELAWRLYIRLSFSLLNSARTSEALAMRDIVGGLPPSRDPVRAALADGMWGRVLAYTWDDTAEAPLATAAAALETVGDRDFLPSILTVRGMIAGPRDSARAIALLGRAVQLASEAGHTYTEGWARAMIIYTQFMAGAIDEAQRTADEAAAIARRQQNDEGAAFVLIGFALLSLQRNDLPTARSMFAEAAALARSRGAAWPRCVALSGLSSVTVAAGDHAGARALLEESLHYSSGAGFIAVDPVCGTLALALAREGERERALRVFAAVRAGTENETGINAHLTDPTGALRQATREARRILGDPPPVDPDTLDLDSVLQAALGAPRPGHTMTTA
ncbi:MAG TPA: hypothetical protein VI792_01555, partial [Candidatus Eisenbacteria bacterium]